MRLRFLDAQTNDAAFVGRQLRTGWRLMRASAKANHATFLTMSGAMTPAGLHRSCIVPMVQKGLVDVLTVLARSGKVVQARVDAADGNWLGGS